MPHLASLFFRASTGGRIIQIDHSADVARPRVLRVLPLRFGGLRQSPQGTLLAVEGPTGVYTTRRDGSDLRQLTTTGPASALNWAPDGSRLTFFGGHGCVLYAVSSDGSHLTRLDMSDRPFALGCGKSAASSGPLWRPTTT